MLPSVDSRLKRRQTLKIVLKFNINRPWFDRRHRGHSHDIENSCDGAAKPLFLSGGDPYPNLRQTTA
jgi:hypothetical protein